MFDLVFYKNKSNARKTAKKLGFDGVYFYEPFNDFLERGKKPKAEAVLITSSNMREIKSQIAKSRNEYKVVIVQGVDDIINRTIVENKKVDVFLSPEMGKIRDFMHYRNSGLNHVLCKIAVKNDMAIGINIMDISKLDGKEKALRIGRIMQNIRLCSKYNTKLLIASFSKDSDDMVSASDLRSFCNAIGLNTTQTKKGLIVIDEIVNKEQ